MSALEKAKKLADQRRAEAAKLRRIDDDRDRSNAARNRKMRAKVASVLSEFDGRKGLRYRHDKDAWWLEKGKATVLRVTLVWIPASTEWDDGVEYKCGGGWDYEVNGYWQCGDDENFEDRVANCLSEHL